MVIKTCRKSGIYIILNIVNMKCYIGQTSSFKRRLTSGHLSKLRNNASSNSHLQAAWNKYGKAAFIFYPLELIDIPVGLTQTQMKEFLKPYEQWWMDVLQPEYNQAPAAGSNLGHKFSPEVRAAQSARQKGRKHSEETKAKMSAARMGYQITEEHRKNLSLSHQGYKPTPEARANQGRARLGHPVSLETRAKIGDANRGRTDRPPIGPETRARMSAASKGRKQSEETIAKRKATFKANRARRLAESQEGNEWQTSPS